MKEELSKAKIVWTDNRNDSTQKFLCDFRRHKNQKMQTKICKKLSKYWKKILSKKKWFVKLNLDFDVFVEPVFVFLSEINKIGTKFEKNERIEPEFEGELKAFAFYQKFDFVWCFRSQTNLNKIKQFVHNF